VRAQQDIRDIFEHIEFDRPVAARRLMAKFEGMVDSLEYFPHRCPKVPEAAQEGKDWRQLLHEAYRMIFSVEEDTVSIMHVLHGARQLDAGSLED
jgi:plasmid stabilization system protein ParE